MSSSNKTENLNLNQWSESDIPKRTDFNYDNEIIDTVVAEHHANEEIHIDNEQRDMWTNFMYSGYYYGNGYRSRTVVTDCPFDAMCGFVYADDYPPSVYYSSNGQTHHYVSLISQFGNSIGARLEENMKDITVYQSLGAEIQSDYSNLNQIGVMYRYVLFRDNRIFE